MPIVHGFRQRVGDTSTHPDHGGLFDAEFHGNGVGRPEADTADVAGKPIGVFAHHLHGIGTIGLEDTNCPRCAHAVAVQEDHDFPHDLLLCPGLGDTPGAYRTNAINLMQAVRGVLDDVENLVTKALHELLGVNRSDTADHA